MGVGRRGQPQPSGRPGGGGRPRRRCEGVSQDLVDTLEHARPARARMRVHQADVAELMSPHGIAEPRRRGGGGAASVLRVLPEPGEPGELLVQAGVLLDLLAPARDLHLDLVLLLLLVERRLAAQRRRRVHREVRHVLLVGGERRRVPRARRDRAQPAIVEQPAAAAADKVDTAAAAGQGRREAGGVGEGGVRPAVVLQHGGRIKIPHRVKAERRVCSHREGVVGRRKDCLGSDAVGLAKQLPTAKIQTEGKVSLCDRVNNTSRRGIRSDRWVVEMTLILVVPPSALLALLGRWEIGRTG